MRPQYTVALRLSRSYSMVAYLKRSKSRIVHLLSYSFFSSQPSTLMREVTQLKQPLIVRESPKDGYFVLRLKRNHSWCWWTLFVSAHMCGWCINCKCVGSTTSQIERIKKEQKQVSIKRFLKRNLADVGMSQYMNALTDKCTNKKCHAHSNMHSITWQHYSKTIPT